jgi:hypothetical protein
MRTWTSDELERIAAADELKIAPVRRDGTLRNPVTDWVVRHGDDLYVRSVNGPRCLLVRGVQARHEGHVQAGGVDRDVRLVETVNLNDEIDAAYRTKYHRYAASIVSSEARATTLKLVPQ